MLQARRLVAQGLRYEALDPPSGAPAAGVRPRAPMPGRAITDAEVRELVAGIDPPELKHLPAAQRYALQRERQDQERRERNKANGVPEVDPQWQKHWNSLTPEERERLRRTSA